MKSIRIPAGREVYLELARLTRSNVVRRKYLSIYRLRLHRDWGWTA